MKKAELVLDPVSGEFIEQPVRGEPSDTPRESWRRGGEKDAFDFSFEYEGATIYAHYANNLNKWEIVQSTLLADSQNLQERVNALTVAKNNPRSELSSEIAEGLEAELKAQTQAIGARMNALAQEIVTTCICGWKDAPVPYSPEARDELPYRICIAWMRSILQESQLSVNEATFSPAN